MLNQRAGMPATKGGAGLGKTSDSLVLGQILPILKVVLGTRQCGENTIC